MPKAPSMRKPASKKTVAAKPDPSAAHRADVVRRLWLAADAQVRQLEARLAETMAPDEREREARALAVLVKTLRDLNELDTPPRKRAAQGNGATDAADVNQDDPRAIDDFRRELARRIEAIRSGTAADIAGEP